MCQSQTKDGVWWVKRNTRAKSPMTQLAQTAWSSWATWLPNAALMRRATRPRIHAVGRSVEIYSHILPRTTTPPYFPRAAKSEEHYVDATSPSDCRRHAASSFDYDGRATEVCATKSRRKWRVNDRSRRVPADDGETSSVLCERNANVRPGSKSSWERRQWMPRWEIHKMRLTWWEITFRNR